MLRHHSSLTFVGALFFDMVICLKRIVLHNPKTQSYCVMVYNGKQLKLVSWNNAGDDYGHAEWSLK